MSVLYDSDPGRLEVYRPRPDGLMGRSFCGSAVIHLLLGVIICTVHLPAPKPPPMRHYRITQVTLLPRSKPLQAVPEEEALKPEPPGPRDLSLFLNDIAPASRRHRRSRRHSHHQRARVAAPRAPVLARDVRPDAPEPGPRASHVGPRLAEGLPNMLERPMADQQALDPTASPTPSVEHGGAPPAAPRPSAPKPVKSVEAPRPHPVRARAPRVPRPAPPKMASVPVREPAAAEPAPKPVMVARAERPRVLPDVTPARHEDGGITGPAPVATPPVDKPKPEPVERPVEMPSGRSGAGKRVAQLPGDLFGSGSGMGPAPSRRDSALPEGRPGAAADPGPRRPRVSRAHADHTAPGGGDSAGISALPAAGGVHLPEDERPGSHRRGEPSDLGTLSGKGTPVASLPSTGTEAPGGGSGASAGGSGAGGGYGQEGPRAFGGGDRPGRHSARTHTPSPLGGDGTGGKSASTDGGIGIPDGGTGGRGTGSAEPHAAGHGSGGSAGDGEGPGKRVARADLPADGPGGEGSGASGPGRHSSSGGGGYNGPKSFENGGKRRTRSGTTSGDGEGSARGKGKSGGSGDGDGKGVALPGGGGGEDDGPGRDGGDGDADSSFKKGRREPAGVYVDTTGNFTLPGAIYDGDYRYNSLALRKIMDELNSRTKVKVQLGGQYQSIAPGSFKKAPVVVFTGHKAFELTDEQRKILKEYVDSGGMIWADLSHAAFDNSFRDEMEKIFGRRPTQLSSSHQIYRSFYVLHGPPPSDLGSAEPFEGISVGDRLGVIITPNRYFSTVTRGLNASEEAQEAATQAVVNIYMYAAANYKAVKDQ